MCVNLINKNQKQNLLKETRNFSMRFELFYIKIYVFNKQHKHTYNILNYLE